jgi:chloramphenicol-sensitive protein RarD
MTASTDKRKGILYGLAAYGWWGFVAIYFKVVAHVAPLEVLAQRVVWSVVLLSILIHLRGRTPEMLRILRDRKCLLTLILTASLISINWLVFIWAVGNGYLLQASLGYFINPLVNILLGVVFLRERLSRWQTVSVGLAAVAVIWLTLQTGQFPVIALTLAFTFGIYGLLRKQVKVDGMLGLNAETLLLLPLALAYLIWSYNQGSLAFGMIDTRTTLLLTAAGVVTALPLVWFVNSAQRLPYSTVGFLQYIAPSLQFAQAVVLFHEPFTRMHACAFSLIWLALLLFSWDTFRANRQHS